MSNVIPTWWLVSWDLMWPIGGELVTTITSQCCWGTHFLYLSNPPSGNLLLIIPWGRGTFSKYCENYAKNSMTPEMVSPPSLCATSRASSRCCPRCSRLIRSWGCWCSSSPSPSSPSPGGIYQQLELQTNHRESFHNHRKHLLIVPLHLDLRE